MRSISLYGLSDVTLTFRDSTDDYFARQRVFERLPDVDLPTGITPSVSPLFSPSGLVYRYVIESPDRTRDGAQEHPGLGARAPIPLRAGRGRHELARRRDDAVPGGDRPRAPRRPWTHRPAVAAALSANNSNAGGGFYSEGGQFYYVRGLGRMATTEDIGRTVVAVSNGTPVLVKDIGEVVIGARAAAGAVRLRQT